MKYCKLRFKWKYLFLGVIFLFFLDEMGVFTHFSELDFDSTFQYPYVGDVKDYVKQLRKGVTPKIAPINDHNYRLLANASQKCGVGEAIRLVNIVKSAAANLDRRQVIRNSWGHEHRFSDVPIKTVFVVGMVDDADTLITILHERDLYQDIVHVDFADTYFNNTIKTISALKWAVTFCPDANYYLFSDDDMYVSTKNVLRFVRNPVNYPRYLENSELNVDIYHIDLPSNVIFYAGYVFNSSPLRHKMSKWYVSLEEYPYDMWPPYATAGCYILSREALHLMYYTSLYTKLFRFDDIFLGLVAMKAGIEIFHSNEFYMYRKPYSLDDYRNVIALHGFDKPHVLQKFWNEQKAAGNA